MDEARKTERRERTAAVRDLVMRRAGGLCEACGMGSPQLEMDHFFGGSSKRSLEHLETCWALCRLCHRSKTDNSPTRASWLERFLDHAQRHGYAAAAALTDAKLEAAWLKR